MNGEVNTTQSLKRQSIWLLAAKIVAFGFSFALPLVIVRSLTQENVGLYRESFQIVTNAIILLPLGLSMSAYYFLARERTRRGAVVLNILIFNGVIGAFACLTLSLFPQLIGNLFRSEDLTRLAPLIGVVIWLWIFASFLETVAIANQEARAATGFIVLAAVSKTVMLGGAVLTFGSVESFLYAAILQGAIQTVVLAFYLRSRFPRFWRDFDPRFFREQVVYAVPFGLTGILFIAQYDIHNYFVGYKFTSAEFAIYAYGCFQVPLVAMLAESVTAVLMPRMNELHQAGERDEMIRLTARCMEKLAFFYFPIYVFLMITSQTFIETLFTRQYSASASIFVINLTLLPFGILITDPVVRAFKELGRSFLLTRVFVLTMLVGVLYFALPVLSLTGMIAVAVGAIILDKVIGETMVVRKLGLGLRHLPLLGKVAKTALVSAFAGLITYFVYTNFESYLFDIGRRFAADVLLMTGGVEFVGGCFVLLASAAVFTPVYLIAANLWGLIEQSERQAVSKIFRRFSPWRGEPLVDSQI